MAKIKQLKKLDIEKETKALNIGVALSGGGARATAHLALLKHLDLLTIKPQNIAASSAGALIAALYCNNWQWQDILLLAEKAKLWHYITFAFSKQGIFSLDGLDKLIAPHLPKYLEDLPTKLFITTTDLETGVAVYHEQGEIMPLLKASMAIPGIIKPIMLNGQLHCDGGITDNLPLEPLKNNSQYLIGSFCNHTPTADLNHLFQLSERSFNLLNLASASAQFKGFDYLFMPDLSGFKVFDARKVRKIFEHACQKKINMPHKLQSFIANKQL